MLTKTDLNQFGKTLRQEILKRFEEQDKRIDAKFEEQDKRIDAKFEEQDKRIDKKFINQRKAINSDIADFINSAILPTLEKISDTLSSIDRTLDNHEDGLFEHGDRIEKLEKIHPRGAHL